MDRSPASRRAGPSLRARLYTAFASVVLLVVAFVATYYPARLAREFDQRLEAETSAAATLLSHHLSPAVEFEDPKAARQGLQGVGHLRDVTYVAVVAGRGELLAERGERAVALRPGPPQPRAWRERDRLVVEQPLRGVEGRVIGLLHLESSLARLREKRREDLRATVAVGIGILALGVLAAYVLQRLLVRPVLDVTAGVERITRGERDAPDVPVTSNDEVGRLARAFNAMRHELRRTTVSRDFLDHTVDALADPLLVVTPAGRVESMNRALFDLLGSPEVPIVGQPLEGTPLAPLGTAWRRVLEAHRVQDVEVALRDGHGETIPMVVNGSRVLNAQGEVEAVLLLGRDVRETRRLLAAAARAEVEARRAEELDRAYRQLDEAHRELQSTQAQLVQQGRLAAVGELAAGVAHELNNPLTAVLTYAVLLGRKLETLPPELSAKVPEFHRQLSLIQTGAKRCKTISDNLLNFARSAPAELGPVKLQPVVDATFDLIGTLLERRRTEVVSQVPAELSVWGAEGELQQVFTNLAMNACQAMSDGGTLTVVAERAGEDRVRISFRDTGQGIPPDVLQRVFDPFFTTKPIGEGTGLGLSIVHGIVKRHRGEIRLRSEVGVGTTVEILLPTGRE
ncbi:MAG: HAMP domain-containing protein [Deltaproteobacteria bacterium]|nr:HAMP domain-containing protein [Deltaproteobacteria bacterium]